MESQFPFSRDVVLVGGGHAHALLLRAWGMRPVAGARLTLINPDPSAPYTGMLPGHVAGHYDREDLEIDLVRLARHAGARLIFGRVDGIDRTAQRLSVAGRPPIPYDIAALDIGITSDMPGIPGFRDHAVPAKPLGPFAERWRAFLGQKNTPPVVVIGGGVGGIELALAMRHRLREAGRDTHVTVIEASEALSGIGAAARRKLLARLEADGIGLKQETRVSRITAEAVQFEGGDGVEAGLVVGAAGARPFKWLEDTGLHLTDGYVTVDANLRSVTDPSIYAAGDCAHLSHAPRPKAGVFAVRAAPILVHNIRVELTGGARRRFDPQRHYLKLISLGEKSALTDKWGIALEGPFIWRWKDRIDRRFMDRLADLPAMHTPRPKDAVRDGDADHEPLCGGCGSKVGPGALDAAIARTIGSGSSNGEGPGDDAAVLSMGDITQVISTDHLRAFWSDPYVMARIAAVHALGDVWAMGATPQAMLAQITLPRMTERLQSAWLDDIMNGAAEIAADAGAQIVGGHTSMGAELTIGFTVTGLVQGKVLSLGGAKAGDRLLLTRPIGTGTIMAAEMRGKARGTDVARALAQMSAPQGDVARILTDAATAMTDVTGFGLAGHAARMAEAASLTAEIDLGAVPILNGAEALSTDGIRSTIFEANRSGISSEFQDSARAALLFDPQTSGGFLAAVPPERVRACLESLSSNGLTAWVIGQMTDSPGPAVRLS